MTIDVGSTLGWIIALVGLIVTVTVAWRLSRSKSTLATVDLLEKGLAVRDQALADQKAEHAQSIAELEQRCRADTARLEGRIDTLTGEFASTLGDRMADRVGEKVASAVVEALQRKA